MFMKFDYINPFRKEFLMDAIGDQLPVVVMTAYADTELAIEALRAGAHDFLVKPFEEGRFLSAVQNALSEAGSRDTPKASDTATQPVTRSKDAGQMADGSGFIGSSEAMERIHATISSVARSMATVFITGESGTGKEVVPLMRDETVAELLTGEDQSRIVERYTDEAAAFYRLRKP